jgi:hypothetical protein
VPDVHEQDGAGIVSPVPHLVLERVVEHEGAALLPRPDAIE